MHEVPQINPYYAFVTDAVTICEINFFMISTLALACVLGKLWEFFADLFLIVESIWCILVHV